MRQAILSRQQTESWYWQECLQLIDYAKAAIEHAGITPIVSPVRGDRRCKTQLQRIFVYFFGGWCLFVTLICCIIGMYNKDPFTFALNVITPVVLTALGIIMSKLAECERAKESGK